MYCAGMVTAAEVVVREIFKVPKRRFNFMIKTFHRVSMRKYKPTNRERFFWQTSYQSQIVKLFWKDLNQRIILQIIINLEGIMNKKDRIAVVFSVPVLILCSLGAMTDGILFTPAWFVIAYWGYRFIKGDISFIGSRIQKED